MYEIPLTFFSFTISSNAPLHLQFAAQNSGSVWETGTHGILKRSGSFGTIVFYRASISPYVPVCIYAHASSRLVLETIIQIFS